MALLKMMDELLRNRHGLYAATLAGQGLGALGGRLLAIFVLTSCLYGGVMGAFRTLHPAYFFSDFELLVPGEAPVRGKVAGLSAAGRQVFTKTAPLPVATGGSVRFNLSDPSVPYPVSATGGEQGYGRITLAGGAPVAEPEVWQLPLLVALKTPLVFVLTLLVCGLALYVLNLAFGLQLRFLPAMTLILLALAGTGVMLAVFAPIALLFTVVTASYHFVKLLHVIVFGIAALFGVKILAEGLARMTGPPADGCGPARPPGRTRLLLLAWLLLYCLVGAQMAWTLKPFLGTPYLPETPPFRVDKGNLFVNALESWRQLRGR